MVAYFLPCFQMRFPVQQTQQLNREPQVAFAMSIIKSLFSKPGASTSVTWLFAVSLRVIHGTYWKRKSYWYMRCYRSKVDHFARVEASIASLVFVLLLGATWSREWWMGITSSYNLTCYSYFFAQIFLDFFEHLKSWKSFDSTEVCWTLWWHHQWEQRVPTISDHWSRPVGQNYLAVQAKAG